MFVCVCVSHTLTNDDHEDKKFKAPTALSINTARLSIGYHLPGW